MTWTDFVLLYFIVAAGMCAALLFTGRVTPRAIADHALLVLGAMFFVDQAAESRQLWFFDHLKLGVIFDVPLENVVFTLASSIYALTCYFLAQPPHGKQKVQ